MVEREHIGGAEKGQETQKQQRTVRGFLENKLFVAQQEYHRHLAFFDKREEAFKRVRRVQRELGAYAVVCHALGVQDLQLKEFDREGKSPNTSGRQLTIEHFFEEKLTAVQREYGNAAAQDSQYAKRKIMIAQGHLGAARIVMQSVGEELFLPAHFFQEYQNKLQDILSDKIDISIVELSGLIEEFEVLSGNPKAIELLKRKKRGKALRAIRINRGVRLDEIGSHISRDKKYVSQVEKGKAGLSRENVESIITFFENEKVSFEDKRKQLLSIIDGLAPEERLRRVGTLLAQLRSSTKLTPAAVGEFICITQSAISLIERENRSISVADIRTVLAKVDEHRIDDSQESAVLQADLAELRLQEKKELSIGLAFTILRKKYAITQSDLPLKQSDVTYIETQKRLAREDEIATIIAFFENRGETGSELLYLKEQLAHTRNASKTALSKSEKSFTVSELVAITGLSEKTIRNIRNGVFVSAASLRKLIQILQEHPYGDAGEIESLSARLTAIEKK